MSEKVVSVEDIIKERLGDATYGVDKEGKKVLLSTIVAQRFADAAKVNEVLDLVGELTGQNRKRESKQRGMSDYRRMMSMPQTK